MKNRWIVLAAGIVIQTILGGIYAWSVFVPGLGEIWGLCKGQSGAVFGVCIAVFAVSMIFAGRMLSRRGPRFTALTGAVLFGSGYILASYSGGRFLVIMTGIGLLAGAGTGFGYVCPLTTSMQWFPKHKGLISGLAVAGFGGGAILLSSAATRLLNGGMDVLEIFRWMGWVLGASLAICALLLTSPRPQSGHAAGGDWSRMCTPHFRLATTGMFAGTFAGLLVIGHLTPMAVRAGLSLDLAARAVALFAAGNAAGRIAWGCIFDRSGHRAIPISLVGLAVVLMLFSVTRTTTFFMTASALLGFGFGANFVIYAAALSAHFGLEAFPRIYPFCFLGYGIAGLGGPPLGGWLAEQTGAYTPAILVSIALLVATAILTALGLRSVQPAAPSEENDQSNQHCDAPEASRFKTRTSVFSVEPA